HAIGVSNFQIHHLEKLMANSDVIPAANQIESSPQFNNNELIEFSKKHNIAVEAWSPLGGTGGSLLQDLRLAPIAQKYGKSVAQVVIRWHIQRGVIVLPKSTHAERIRQNLDVFDFELNSEDMVAINAINTNQRNGADPDNFNF
ncbi:MAG: aldo/keto reductase, partial [Bifidobacteriaceae bacterium]|nr:aldo/keto reductase [Bifidobacteriaceae bacterium]